MKKFILIPLFLGTVLLAGCQRIVPADDTLNTGSQNTGVQSTGNAQQTGNQSSYHFNLNGTEPFRGANLSGGNLAISMPSDTATNNIFTTTIGVSEMGDEETLLFTNINQATIVTLMKESCSDGMGPTEYDYKAIMIRSGTVYQGCAKTQ